MKLFMDNMNGNTTENDIKILFGQFGAADEVKLVFHADGIRRRGFVYVEMLENENAIKAIVGLNAKYSLAES